MKKSLSDEQKDKIWIFSILAVVVPFIVYLAIDVISYTIKTI